MNLLDSSTTEEINKQRRIKYQLKKDKINKNRRMFYERNKETLKIKEQPYRIKYRSSTKRKECTKRYRDKKQEDTNFQIKNATSARIRKAVQRGSKAAKTCSLLGCTIPELKLYLQSKFTNNMNWKNYGQWHIDHIKPCASFDLTVVTEQYKCFHYTNLQPLWAIDNLKKGTK